VGVWEDGEVEEGPDGDGADVDGEVDGAEGELVCAKQGRGRRRRLAITATRMSCSSGLTPLNV
jgi:hypothetical protein